MPRDARRRQEALETPGQEAPGSAHHEAPGRGQARIRQVAPGGAGEARPGDSRSHQEERPGQETPGGARRRWRSQARRHKEAPGGNMGLRLRRGL